MWVCGAEHQLGMLGVGTNPCALAEISTGPQQFVGKAQSWLMWPQAVGKAAGCCAGGLKATGCALQGCPLELLACRVGSSLPLVGNPGCKPSSWNCSGVTQVVWFTCGVQHCRAPPFLISTLPFPASLRSDG